MIFISEDQVQKQESKMSDKKWSSVAFEKEFLEELDEHLKENTLYSSRKEFLKHAAQNEIEKKD